MGDSTNDIGNVNTYIHTYIYMSVHVFIYTHIYITCYAVYVILNPGASLQAISLSLLELHDFLCCSFLAETERLSVKLS